MVFENLRKVILVFLMQAPFVASITTHPSFNDINLYNDVAVLHLITEFDKTATKFGVVRLPSKSKKSHKKYNCVATGWGRRGFGKYKQTIKVRNACN